MDLGVGRVAELVGHDPARVLGQDRLGPGDRPLHPLLARRQHDLRAQEPQHLAALDRDRFRHGQDQPVPARGADEGQAYAGIAGGGLHQDRVRPDPALGLQCLDHRHADPVLDAGDRVEELELEQEVGRDPLLGAQPAGADQRRVADGLGDAVVHPPPQRRVEAQAGHGSPRVDTDGQHPVRLAGRQRAPVGMAVLVEIIAPIFGIVLIGWLAARLRRVRRGRDPRPVAVRVQLRDPGHAAAHPGPGRAAAAARMGLVLAYFAGAGAVFALGAAVGRGLFGRRGAGPPSSASARRSRTPSSWASRSCCARTARRRRCRCR